MNRILIATGNPTAAEEIQNGLSHAGHQTAVITDCHQLLAFCGQHTPDLVVVDLELPGGNVLSALPLLRAESRLVRMPVVGFGGADAGEERREAMASGFSAVVGNPFSLKELLDTVHSEISAMASNITPMPQQSSSPSPGGASHDPVGILNRQIAEVRELTAALKPGVAGFGEEAPELFEYIENSGNQIHEELSRLSSHGVEHSAVALQDKDLRHDFRNMIGSVTGFSELLLMEPSVAGEDRVRFTRIREICRDFCEVLDQQKAAAA